MNAPNSAEALIHFYSRHEERLNAISHGLGGLAALGGIFILAISARSSGAMMLGSVLIYGATLLTMYLASTFYHAARSDRWKIFFRKLDHCAIYLLIAGTYTPLMLLAVGGTKGWSVLIAVWTAAVLGIIVKCFTLKDYRGLSLYFYLLMGWLCVLCIHPLWLGMSAAGMACLIAGGVFYTAGVFFFISERPYFHAIWHLFVLAGTTSHFLSIWELV